MNDRDDRGRAVEAAGSFARGIRYRFGALVLASAVAVALVFGCTFYFALLANESAVARQIPELGQVAAQMKNLLLLNTIVFAGIIVASFYALSVLIAARAFRPLGDLYEDLRAIAVGSPASRREARPAGAFAELESAFRAAAERLAEKERAESAELAAIADNLSEISAATGAAAKIRDLIARRSGPASAPKESLPPERGEHDPLFIQPV